MLTLLIRERGGDKKFMKRYLKRGNVDNSLRTAPKILKYDTATLLINTHVVSLLLQHIIISFHQLLKGDTSYSSIIILDYEVSITF